MGKNIQHKGAGLKVKILFGIFILLMAAIIGILSFTNLLIVADKKAYVFENSLSKAEEVRNLIHESVQNSLFLSESLARLSLTQIENIQSLMDKQEFVDALSFKFEGDTEEKKLIKTHFPKNTEVYADFVSKWLDQSQFSERVGIHLKKIPKRNSIELEFKDDQKTLRLLINMENLWERLSNDLSFSYTVVDANRIPLWMSGEKLQDFPYSEMIQANGVSVSKEVSINGEDYLVAVSSLPELGIHIVSYIASARAFGVAKELSLKTIAFGLVLLGFSFIIGLFFSKRLTGPIESLVEGTNYMAEGNFDHVVKVKTKDELSILGERFNFMSGKIKGLLGEKELIIEELRGAKAQIEDYSKNLEQKVEERTRELKSANDFIQAMIDSLDQGLFVFGPDLKCSPVYTKACEELFRKSPDGLTFDQVLDLNGNEKNLVEKWASILFDEMLSFDSAVGLGIKEKVYGESIDSEDYSILHLHYHPMRTEEGKLSDVVVVATDKTSEVRALEEGRKKERYVEMIFKILGAKRHFLDFIQETEEYFKGLDREMNYPEAVLDKAMLIYHTLTGGFGLFAIDHLMEKARSCEQTIVDMKNGREFSLNTLLREKEEFQNDFQQFKQSIFATLGLHSNSIEVDQGILLYLNDLIQNSNNKELKYVFSEKIMKVPVEQFFVPYKSLLETLGPKLGKELAPLEVKNGDVRVDPHSYREFFSQLVHLFRNCADHGIETPEVREACHKSIQGHIRVMVEDEEGGTRLKLVVEDDGAGINPSKIRKKLEEKNPGKSFSEESDESIIYHIFDQDFSTAEQVTTISGRGVGMSSIKDVVDGMNGEIRLHSEVGKGTKFIFLLPKRV